MTAVGRTLIALACLFLAAPSHAKDLARGRQLYRKGEAAFAMGNYREAADLFQEAYEQTGKPQLLWNLAATWRKLYDVDRDPAQLRRARSIYENYAAVIGVAREEEEARRQIAEIDETLAATAPAAKGPPAGVTSPSGGSGAGGVGPGGAGSGGAESSGAGSSGAESSGAESSGAGSSGAESSGAGSGGAEPGGAVGLPSTAPAPSDARTPVYKRWWLWTTVAGVAVVGAGLGTGFALGLTRDATAPDDATAGNFRPMFP